MESSIKVRLTTKEKEQLKKAAHMKKTSMSNLVRSRLSDLFGQRIDGRILFNLYEEFKQENPDVVVELSQDGNINNDSQYPNYEFSVVWENEEEHREERLPELSDLLLLYSDLKGQVREMKVLHTY